MKTLIFGGLVLGSITYLIATQSDLLSHWLDDIEPHTEQMVVESQKQFSDLFTDSINARSELNSDALIKTLNEKVRELETEIIRLNSTAQAEMPVADESSIYEANSKVSQLINRTSAHQELIENDALNPVADQRQHKASPYMPVNERSEALIALINRMEMKAANF